MPGERHAGGGSSGARRPSTSDRPPCPVCGHPTGDCTADDHEGLRPAFSDWSDDAPPREDALVRVPFDVYEDVAGPRERTPRWRLAARSGALVDAERAKELGIMPDEPDGNGNGNGNGDGGGQPGRDSGSPREKVERPPSPREKIERK